MAKKKDENELLQEQPEPKADDTQTPPAPNSEASQEESKTPAADPTKQEQPGAEKNQTAGADTPQEPPTPQNDPPPKETEPPKSGNTPNPLPNGKKRIRHESLKNEAVSVFDGTLILFDETGTAEIDAPYADYLLQIPGYSEAKE